MNRKIAGLLAMAMLAGCGGGGGNAGSMTPSAPGQAAGLSAPTSAVHLAPFHGSPELANFTWGKGMLERTRYVAATQVGALSVYVQVRMRDPHGLAQYALSTSNP
jgi:hypothetical protein